MTILYNQERGGGSDGSQGMQRRRRRSRVGSKAFDSRTRRRTTT